MSLIISLVIGYSVLVWVIALFLPNVDNKAYFSLKVTGVTIALCFLAFFMYIIKLVLFN